MESDLAARDPAVDVMVALKKRGYIYNFKYENGVFYCLETKRNFEPWQITIDASFRFEGESNPDDAAILYAISAEDLRGTFMEPFGALTPEGLSEFLKSANDLRAESTLMDDFTVESTREHPI